MRKFVVFCVSFVFAISSFVYAFADDPSPDTSPDPLFSSGEEYSSEELYFLSNASDDRDLIIRQSVIDAVRSTSSTYTLDDIYSLLIALVTTQHSGLYEWKVYDTSIYNQINNNFSHYDSYTGNTYDTGAMLWLILSHLNNLDTDFTPALSSNPSMYELTADLDDTLNSLWLAFQAHAASQVNYSSALWYNNIGVAQYAYQNNQTTANVFTLLNNTLRPLINNIDTNISYLKTNSDTLVSNTNTISNTLTSIQSDINNISWKNINSTIEFKDFNNNSLTNINNLNNIDVMFKLNLTGSYSYRGSIFRIDLPIDSQYYFRNDNIVNIIGLYSTYTTNIPLKYEILSSFFNRFEDHNTYTLIIYLPNFSGQELYIRSHIYIESGYFSLYNFNSVKYLPFDSQDYYTVSSWLINKEHYDLWKELYASDDIIAAKDDQALYESQALNDFSGSGTAAGKVSDLNNLKSVSGTIQSGLQSGGSVSNALAPFNTSGGFWGWFSSQNSDNINNPNLQTRDSQFIDFYSDNQLTLQSLLRGEER